MPSPDIWEDEWYSDRFAGGARHIRAPQRRSRDFDDYHRRTSEFLVPESRTTTSLHRTRSQGHSPAPHVTIYNTTKMENESSPNVRTEQKSPSVQPYADSRGRTRKMPGEWGLEDDIAELRLDIAKQGRSRSRSKHFYRDDSPARVDMEYERWKLEQAQRAKEQEYDRGKLEQAQRLKEQEYDRWKLEQVSQRNKEQDHDRWRLEQANQRMKEQDERLEMERREELIKRKMELKYLKDRHEREEEEERIRRDEERLKREWELKHEREERKRMEHEEDAKREEDRLRKEWELKMEREARKKELDARAEEVERKRLIDESMAKAERHAKEQEEERQRIIQENTIKLAKADRERKEAQQRAVDEFNKERAEKEAKAKAERDRVVAEYEAKKVADAAEAKRKREELIMQLKIEEEQRKQKEKEEWERFLMRQRQKEEEEKAAKSKQEKELEEEMRKRLAQFGFQDNQIQAMVRPEEAARLQQGMSPANPIAHAHSPMRLTHQPTFVKVSKDHLAIDTLLYYDIPYEIDRADPNYIIIMREMEPRETEILFEHTRRLRSRGSTRLLIEEHRDHGKNEYAWVRRRKPSRSPSMSRRRSSPKRVVGIKEMFF